MLNDVEVCITTRSFPILRSPPPDLSQERKVEVLGRIASLQAVQATNGEMEREGKVLLSESLPF